jgi:ATP-dependent 26S proteasome regulatory subunit
MAPPMDEERKRTLDEYRTELLKSRELESKLKDIRLEIRELQKEYERTEDSIKALQSVGQIIGEVLKQLPDERCKFAPACPIEMPSHSDPSPRSHRQGLFWPPLCRRLPIQARQGQAEAGHPRGP